MIKSFNYFNPVHIHFGYDAIRMASNVLKDLRVLLVTSKGFVNRGLVTELEKQLNNSFFIIDSVSPNPSLQTVGNLYKESYGYDFDIILAVGGGSVIDTAKVLSVRTKEGNFTSITKLIHLGVDVEYTICPVVAIPTTSGTSSEITPWATIWDPVESRKYSLHLPDLWCKHAIYDPHLTVSLPESITISSGLDSLSHSFEALWNINSNPISTHFALEAIEDIMKYLPRLREDLSDLDVREKIMLASCKAGLAFSNTKTAIAHAISYSFTLEKSVPHGIACSFTLPFILETALSLDVFDPLVKQKLIQISKKDFVEWFGSLGVSCSFEDYNITIEDLYRIKGQLSQISRSQNSLVDENALFSNFVSQFS
ncbi:phosphonoacetaldehyde reductase [Paenibacillus sp. M1]|uniref:Phosphonoacetaldehyde reductase n=1 Tax=Paenibacillus haidiansis TaxID=1574488 RepID=A0ABU7VWE8_9BACL